MSDSLRPCSPWNSPDQNTGVGSFSLLQGIFPTQDRSQVSRIAGDSLPAEPQGKPKNTGVGSLSFLQWIFPSPGSNPCLLCLLPLHTNSFPLSHQGSPILKMKVKVAQSCLTLFNLMDYTVHGILQNRILEWVAFTFSRASSQPRDRSQVSCIAGRFFTS